MARYTPRHAPRHAATPRGRGRGAHAAARRRSPVFRPVLTTGVLAAVVGGAAMAAAVTEDTASAATLTLAIDSNTTSASTEQSKVAVEDATRVTADRTASNAQLSVLAAKNAAAEKARAEAAAKKRQAEAARAAREAERKRVLANAQDDPKSVAQLLMPEYGFDQSQWSCLDQLWIGESDWRWWAENQSSGAYGIPQSLPASKMGTVADDYLTNPVTQIRWGLNYIRSSYGTPCNALNQWLARSPHWY
jgi:hypothetical protein